MGTRKSTKKLVLHKPHLDAIFSKLVFNKVSLVQKIQYF